MPAPANDNITNAELLVGNSGTVTGTTVDSTEDTPYDALTDEQGTSDSVWYKIALPDGWDASWKMRLRFSSGDTTLVAYPIAMAPGNTFPPDGVNFFSAFDTIFSGDGLTTSEFVVDPPADDGYVYIGIGAFGANDAEFTLSWAFIHPRARTFEGRRWRWVIADLRTSRVLTSLTTIATDITTTRELHAAWPASLTVPSDDPRVRTTYEQFDEHPEWDEPFVARSIRALIGFRDTGVEPLWEPAYTGPVFQVADTVDDGVPRTRLNSWDCRKYLEFVPLVDADGDLPGPDGITFTAQTANVIARAALQNWIDANPGCLAETMFDLGSGTDEECAAQTMTFSRGTTIADVWNQLEQTGAIDIVLDPFFDQAVPGVLAIVNFKVQHGSERPASIFSWDRSPRSLPSISRMEDGLKLANTIQDYTDDVEPTVPATNSDSATRFGEYVAMRAWVGQLDADAVASFALEELLFRQNGQTTVSASPSAQRAAQPVQDYDIGDRVPVYASERLRKPLASTMRIYGIPFTIDENAYETVTELIVSADAVTA